MARHVGKHGARHSLWGGVAVFVVIALTGFLLSTNVRVNRTVAATNDTADLVEQGVDEANQLQQDVSDLTKQVANLTDALKADGTDGTDSTQNQGKDSSNVDSSLMLPALSGSGVTVTLDDSPLWENAVNNNGTTANINDYVIHQQDVESVVNALWAGGADARISGCCSIRRSSVPATCCRCTVRNTRRRSPFPRLVTLKDFAQR